MRLALLSMLMAANCLPVDAAGDTVDGATALERMTVTGTRLSRTPLDNAFPVTVLDRETLIASGHANLGDFLQELPFMSGSALGTTVNRRGEGGGLSRGVETVELRGLGPERTLVLINGRRVVPGGNGASGVVDLGLIPVAAVERVEVLKTGASVEYGADAVAGVVNVITRGRFEGIELAGRTGASGEGDGETHDASAVFGRDFEDGRVLAGLAYFDQASVGKAGRDFSRSLLTVSGPDNRIVPGGSSAPPGGNYLTSGGRLTLREGADGDSPGDFRPFVDGGPDTDRFNFNPFEDLVQDSERLSAFFQGGYALDPSLEFFVEASWQQRESDTRIAPLPFFTTREEGVVVAGGNLYNPFGERIVDARRRMVEAGPRRFIQDNETWRIVLGADGSIGGWLWGASINRARNRTDQLQTGDLLDDRLALALGPSFRDSSGLAVCGTPADPLPDCVPLNLFGGPGSITDEMLEYVGAGDLMDSGYNEQTVASVNFSGDVVELPAGMLAGAFGYEYRDESGADIPDIRTQRGNTSGAARAATVGGFDSHEAYVEFGAPLLRDRAFAESLDLEFGLRGVNFSNFDSRSVFEVGVHYRPVSGLVVRASFSEAFRAPDIRELFGGESQSNPAVDDPCADFSQLTDAEIERCVAQGVPADGSFDQTGNETPQLGGGNPGLEPEEAGILTLGATWKPAWAEGLTVDLDYYDIEIDNGIASLGANTILEQCLATGAEQFCGRIDRDGSGTILRVRSKLQNIAKESARGVDLALQFAHAAPRGRIEHDLLVSYVDERQLIAFPGAQPFAGAGGYDRDSLGAIPRWKGQYRLRWLVERFEFGYAAEWIGSVTEKGGELFPGTVSEVPGVVYHDLAAGFAPWPQARLTFGIDNAGDEQPPFFANADVANTDVATYRLLGRSYWLRLEYRL